MSAKLNIIIQYQQSYSSRIFLGLSTIVTLVTAIGISFNPSACAYTAPKSRALQRGHVFWTLAFLVFLEVTFQLPYFCAQEVVLLSGLLLLRPLPLRLETLSSPLSVFDFATIGADESIHFGFSLNASMRSSSVSISFKVYFAITLPIHHGLSLVALERLGSLCFQ